MLSTNLPHGAKAIREHLASGVSLSMNVSKEADVVFMQELKRTDPNRYARLEKNIRVSAIRAKAAESQPRCQHCNLRLPLDIRAGSRFCDRTCQQNAYLARKAVRAA